MSRRTARKHAFFLVYQLPFHPEDAREEIMATYFSETSNGNPDLNLDRAFIEDEYRRTILHLEDIDQKISAFSEGWALNRIGRIDLAILRLAICEMDYISEIPVSVSINEAVLLAKTYGADESPVFINGLLGKMDSCKNSKNA